jgi:hypothetical protein
VRSQSTTFPFESPDTNMRSPPTKLSVSMLASESLNAPPCPSPVTASHSRIEPPESPAASVRPSELNLRLLVSPVAASASRRVWTLVRLRILHTVAAPARPPAAMRRPSSLTARAVTTEAPLSRPVAASQNATLSPRSPVTRISPS